jgi:hypothetical protein
MGDPEMDRLGLTPMTNDELRRAIEYELMCLRSGTDPGRIERIERLLLCVRYALRADDPAVAKPASPAGDVVAHPPHYTAHPSGVECITITEHMTFNAGNAVKYIWRAGLKSDDPIEDLKKSAWYINREIERLSK